MRFLLLLPLLALAFGGCAGYQLGPIKPKTMREVQTIAVGSFKNETLHPRMEVLMANAVIKQIQQDGTYQIADEKNADAVLEGILEEIERRPQRGVIGNVVRTREYEVIVRLKYRVYERATGRDLESRSVIGSTNFFVSGTDNISADVLGDERQAIPLAAEDAAIRLVSHISEGW